MKKAQGIVFSAPNQVEIQSYDLPELLPGEVLVRTEYSGVSQGTEVWALMGKRPELTFPTIPGYQSVGVIEELGPEIKGYQKGQRIVFTSSRLPSSFPPTWMGCHTSYAIVKTTSANPPVPLPEDADPVEAALSALAAVSFRGIKMLHIRVGDLVVVQGQGMIGQGSAQFARLRGGIVLATDLSNVRLELSKQYSADLVVNPKEQNLVDAVRSLRPNGADIVVDTTGRADQFAPCIDLLRWEGQFLLQGWYPDPITFDFHRTHGKKPTIAITCGMDSPDIATSLELMRYNKLHYRELITHLLPFTEAPKMYTRFLEQDPSILGVVFDWTQA